MRHALLAVASADTCIACDLSFLFTCATAYPLTHTLCASMLYCRLGLLFSVLPQACSPLQAPLCIAKMMQAVIITGAAGTPSKLAGQPRQALGAIFTFSGPNIGGCSSIPELP